MQRLARALRPAFPRVPFLTMAQAHYYFPENFEALTEWQLWGSAVEYDGWLNFITRDEWFDYWTSFRSTRAAPLSDPSPASTFSFAPDGACEDGTTTLPSAGDGQAGAAHTEEADTWQEEEQYPAEDDSDPKLYGSWGQEPWANVEAVEVAKMACEHFGTLLTNTDICLGEMKDAFPELQRLYERPNEAVVQQRKTLSELMAKVKERKRGDSMSAAGTPAQGTPVEKKEEKKPVAKKMPEDIKKKQQMMKDYEDKQELLKKKLEEAKASAESIGRQRPSEPEGEPKRKRTPEKLSQKGSDDERNLENVDKKWLTKYEDKLNCFWCKGTGHKAADCWKMYEEAKRLKADVPQTVIQGRHLFCGNCYIYLKKIQCQDKPYLGWGSHSRDICFHRKEVEKFLDNEGKASDKPKAPSPSWGLERMKPKISVPEDVKSSGEERTEEKRRKKADQAKGSSRDPPKEEKKKKEKKEKKRRASDSSDIIEGAAKVQKRKDKKSHKDQTSDREIKRLRTQEYKQGVEQKTP